VAVTHAEFSGSGNRVLTWGDDRIVRIFDARTGKALRRLGDVGEKLGAVALSQDGARVLTCAAGECSIKLWDGSSGQLLGVLDGAEAAVTALEFSPDGTRALALSGEAAAMRVGAPAASRPTTHPSEMALRLWDVETRKVVHTFVLPSVGAAASFSMNGKLALVQMNNAVKFYDLASFAEVAAPRSAEENFAAGQFTGDRKTGLWKAIGTAAVTNAATGENVRPLEGPIDGLPLCNVFSRDGGRVILGTGKVALFSRDPNAPGSVYVYDVANGKRVAAFNGHAREVTQVGFSSDASRAFSRDSGKMLFMWAVPK
jgi:WD40 repeat protein